MTHWLPDAEVSLSIVLDENDSDGYTLDHSCCSMVKSLVAQELFIFYSVYISLWAGQSFVAFYHCQAR